MTFAYGGAAMTFNPAGNPGASGGQPGSLFIMGHNRMPWGELPDGNQVAEISIPAPVITSSIDALNQAVFLQPFRNVTAGFFPTLMEIPRAGMQYLDTPATGPLIHLAFGQHLQESGETDVASHAWFSPNLNAPTMRGPWSIGHRSVYSVNEYIFEIPVDWAARYAGGRRLATGRFRDGGWSGMGPSLFAYRPWVDDSGTPAAPNIRLPEIALLQYESSRNTADIVRCMNGYQHPDEWGGGAWLTAAGGKSAVLFAGTKSVGSRYWYGFLHPDSSELACVEEAYLGQFTLCRLADGTPCPDEYSSVCSRHTSDRGWWSTRFNARFILYNPADLAAVAAGTLEAHQPQPYAHVDIDDRLFLNPDGIERDLLGTGPQRRYRIGDVAYDRANGFLYVLELFADGAKPVVHVWRVDPADGPGPDPDPPIVRSPSGNAVVDSRRPEFIWPAEAGATWYQLWIERDGQVYHVPWVQGVTAWTPSVNGLPGGSYRWWVRGWSPGGGYGAWSVVALFRVPVSAPGAVVLTAPAGVQASHILTYIWNRDAQATWYHLWVGGSGSGTWHNRWFQLSGEGEAAVNPGGRHPCVSKPVPSAPEGTILGNRPTFEWAGGQFVWWVRPWGPNGYGPWSGPAHFSVPYPAGTWLRVYVQQGHAAVIDEWTMAGSLPSPRGLDPGTYSWWLGVWDAALRRTLWSDRMDFIVP